LSVDESVLESDDLSEEAEFEVEVIPLELAVPVAVAVELDEELVDLLMLEVNAGSLKPADKSSTV